MIKYNVPIEVNREQYAALTNRVAGYIAHRYDSTSEKFFIKVWGMSKVAEIQKILRMYQK
jgi:hypothetical protein